MAKDEANTKQDDAKRVQIRKLIAVLTINEAGLPTVAKNGKGQQLVAPETKVVALLGTITDMKANGKVAEIAEVTYDPSNPVDPDA